MKLGEFKREAFEKLARKQEEEKEKKYNAYLDELEKRHPSYFILGRKKPFRPDCAIFTFCFGTRYEVSLREANMRKGLVFWQIR